MWRLINFLSLVLIVFVQDLFAELITALAIGATIAGPTIGGIFSLVAANKQEKEDKFAQNINLQFAKRQEKRAVRAERFGERITKERLALDKNQIKFSRIQGVLNNFFSQMNSSPQFKNNITNMWARRAA